MITFTIMAVIVIMIVIMIVNMIMITVTTTIMIDWFAEGATDPHPDGKDDGRQGVHQYEEEDAADAVCPSERRRRHNCRTEKRRSLPTATPSHAHLSRENHRTYTN